MIALVPIPQTWVDLQIGKHGIWIEFVDEHGQTRTATYLPEVAAEQKWDHTETLDSLLRKGKYKAIITDAYRHSVKVTRYQSQKIRATYDEWQAWKAGPQDGLSLK